MTKKLLKKLVSIFRFDPFIKVIAITGGPCGGKSTFLGEAIALLEKFGFLVIVIPEVARELIAAGITPWNQNWKKSTGFQKQIIFHTLEKEASFYRMIDDIKLENYRGVVFLCDRGIPDGAAYCGESNFNRLLKSLGTNRTDVTDRYDGVIHLVTAAEGAPDFYVQDGVRKETLEEAIELDKKTRHAWIGHNHFSIIDNSTSFDEKMKRAIKALNRIIPMQQEQPTEIELKFHLPDFSESMLPEGTKFSLITQIYLYNPEKQGVECRIRKKITDNIASYFYTEKAPTDSEGVRQETERQITEVEFDEYATTYRHLGLRPIRKTRYKIPFEKHTLELDIYYGFLEGLITCECEFPDKEQMRVFTPPTYLGRMINVTSHKGYSNRQLAEFGIPQ